ncbi:hypothetical protein RHGRI_033073 [Rhododendron griersonianum]|uniref:MLH1 n=1 Tax=Rhododendron griersonianum TaxID=479676 RepID=A0AAV6HV97_9ERIC|nr:hypothetical protein RHGRI_033073 [Rhododendron griersonianum]
MESGTTEQSLLMEIDEEDEEVEEEEEEEAVPTPLVQEPPKIHRLDESVVNRIAAGEVIQRPVSAVKELVENSLDAGSTSVNVVVKDGGLKLIQVSDDGHGIRFEDLPILCERHTTSKLSKFEDLQSIQSMGFRGEALASMTYVGHVTVTTITKGQLHGYRVSYRDGVMEHEPKACAAVKGTQIMIENLFYNMTARRKTLQNSADDYPKIVDLLSRFAIHHTNVSFSCRKHGAARPDIHSVATASRLDAIRSVYGVSVARNLMSIEVSDDDPSSSVFKMDGFISNSNYIAKKITMVLFINGTCAYSIDVVELTGRLVECSALKRAIEIVYTATLPKASKPFIYMSVVLPPEHVDVNVHPTKREVSLLNQEIIIEKVQSAVESKLRNSNESRTFQEQVVDPSPSSPMVIIKDSQTKPSASGMKSQKVPVHKMVRTDSQDPAGRLHAYLQVNPSSLQEKSASLTSVRSSIRQRRNPKETADLTSIQQLIDDIDNSSHSDDVFALLQYNTHLYLANVVNLSKELMYQQVLRRFAHFNAIQLSEPAPLSELILLALKEEDLDPECSEKDQLNEKISEMNTEMLKQKAEMLGEYFGIYVDSQGKLSRLPVILDQYTPDMDRVPEFVLCLGNDVEIAASELLGCFFRVSFASFLSCKCNFVIVIVVLVEVDWDDEKSCFQSIAAALGNFYAMHPPLLPNPSGDGLQFYKRRKPFRSTQAEEIPCKSTEDHAMEGDIDQELISEAETAWAQREWSIQHVLFPSMRLFFKPPTSMATNGTFVQVASLEKLYKIFESVNGIIADSTATEIASLERLYKIFERWSKIASHLPGRTDNEIKNVWHTHLKKRSRVKEPNHCDSMSEPSNNSPQFLPSVANRNQVIGHVSLPNSASGSFPSSENEQGTSSMDHETAITSYSSLFTDSKSTKWSEPQSASLSGSEGERIDANSSTQTLSREVVEIPFEPNLDFWDMLDDDSITSSDVPVSRVVENLDQQVTFSQEDNKREVGSWWWLAYLESELGLEATILDGNQDE